MTNCNAISIARPLCTEFLGVVYGGSTPPPKVLNLRGVWDRISALCLEGAVREIAIPRISFIIIADMVKKDSTIDYAKGIPQVWRRE